VAAGERFERLVEIMRALRRGCPWDRSQSRETLRAFLLEETYEVLAALDEGRHDELREELGDLLLQIVFHAELAQEEGLFDIEDVLEGINEKLVRRHPHVFADAQADTPGEVVRRWENIKTRVENKGSFLNGVPAALPALLRAVRVLTKVRQTGVDPLPPEEAGAEAQGWLARLAEPADGDGEGAETAAGMLCLAAAALAMEQGANPEDGLRRVLGRLTQAFQRQEAALEEQGRSFDDLSDEELRRIAARLMKACRGERE